MRSVAEFYQDCLAASAQQPPLDLLLGDAMGCVLAEDVIAPFSHPVTDVAACDGYAVSSRDLALASSATPTRLMVTSEIGAGSTEVEALVPGSAIRIASGAPMPIGADAVAPLDISDLGTAVVNLSGCVGPGDNVRVRGEDFQEGTTILESGSRLTPAKIAALAAVGRERVVVHPQPRVVILSVGDELVEPGVKAAPGTVFDANGHMLAAAVAELGVEAYRVSAVPDERQRLRDVVEDQLMRADLIITTGGLSFGSADTVREVFGALGKVRFDNVAAWPGHMLGVGTVPTDRGSDVPVFALPGDPVAAQVCFEVYVRPALRKMQGEKQINRSAVKGQVDYGWDSPLGHREFVRVKLQGSPRSGYRAQVMGRPDKLWLSALASSNALAIVPEDVTRVNAGDELTCLLLEQ